jgi:hypothetical protein
VPTAGLELTSSLAITVITNQINNGPGQEPVNEGDIEMPYHVDESAGGEIDGPVYEQQAQDSWAHLEAGWIPSLCPLEGCRKNYVFPTYKSWSTHVTNVHNKSERNIVCPEPSCPHVGPFVNNTDLKRHIASVHKKEKIYKCWRPNCVQRIKAWARKDKLTRHNKDHHSNFRCWMCSQTPPHIRWFDNLDELWEHHYLDHPPV